MIIPLGHRILVKQASLDEVDETTKKARSMGLVIPESQDKVRQEAAIDVGTVISIGETAFKDFGGSWGVVPGDTVYFAKYSGKIITDPQTEEKFVVLNDEDLCAKVQNG